MGPFHFPWTTFLAFVVTGASVVIALICPEIAVASTKAFTAPLVALYLFAIALGEARSVISKGHSMELLRELLILPGKVETVLSADEEIRRIAKDVFKARGFLYLGRGINYPIALEGALKLKEIS